MRPLLSSRSQHQPTGVTAIGVADMLGCPLLVSECGESQLLGESILVVPGVLGVLSVPPDYEVL